MAGTTSPLFAGEPEDAADALHATGLLPSQHLRGLIEHSREIRTLAPVTPEQLQPASLDLRLGGSVLRSPRKRSTAFESWG